MSVSAIIYSTINENFPAAGQDNDSQGFRDNFARIKTALGTAQGEITYLNTNAVDKTQNNDLGGNTLSNLILKNSGIRSDPALNSAAIVSVITFSEYQYKRYALNNTSNTFQIDNFPVGCYAQMFLELSSASGTKRALFQPGVLNNTLGSPAQFIHLGAGFSNNNYVDLAAVDGTGKAQSYLFNIASPDGGINTFVRLVDIFKKQV